MAAGRQKAIMWHGMEKCCGLGYLPSPARLVENNKNRKIK